MTKPADRDAAIDRLLKAARPDPSAAAGECLDADTLAAWAGGTLDADERESSERHAADCARCQALLAAMARIEPAGSTRIRRSAWTVARWAVPLSAAAAAALWFAVDRDVAPRTANDHVMEAPAPAATAPTATPSPAVEAPAAADAQANVSAPERDVRKDARARVRGGTGQAAKEDALADATPERREQVTTTAEKLSEAAAVAAPPPPAELLPAAPPAAETAAQPRLTRQKAAADSAAAGVAETLVQRALPAPTWTEVASPDPLVRWRFSPRGDVQRSTDGGETWAQATTADNTLIVAGSAPSSSVCWLAGRGGAVLRFTTARGWQRLTVPDAPDLSGIDAKDANTATVTLANGRRLTTTDGGVSWN